MTEDHSPLPPAAPQTVLFDRHTPGPWAYRPLEHDDWGTVRGPAGEPLARASINYRDFADGALDACRRAGIDPTEANAQLIAAAPEMLAALKPFADLDDGSDGDGIVMAPMRQSEIRAAFLAISKATGGAS